MKPWRSRSPRPRSPGRLKRVGWRISQAACSCDSRAGAPRRPGLQTQVREDLRDHRLFQDRRDDLRLATVVRAVFQVDLEDPLEQLGPAQPHRAMVRTGRLALGRWSCLCGRPWILRHHQHAQLGVGCQYAVVRAAGIRSLREAKLRGHQTDQVQPRSGYQCRQPLHELQRRHHQMRGAVAPGDLELNTTCPAALVCTRSLAKAGRVM